MPAPAFFCLLCVFCASLWLILSTPALAQYRFDTWTIDDGLPHNSVRGICQTRDGYLWLTTWDGVARFDGTRFQVFKQGSTPGLTSNRFSYNAIWEDGQGALWLGTYDAGVIRYSDGQFTAFTTADGLADNRIIRIDGDANGNVWIFTVTGLARWRDGRLVRVAPAPGSPFNDYLEDPRQHMGVDGRLFGLWRMDASGWQRFAYGKWTPLPLPPHLSEPARLRIGPMTEDQWGNLCYALAENDNNYYGVREGHLSIMRNLHAGEERYVCQQDRLGRIWTGSHYGINGFSKDGKFTPMPELVTYNIFRVLEDREGGLWIATFEKGLYRLRQQIISLYIHPAGPQIRSPRAMLQDHLGNIWVQSGSLSSFEDGRFKNYYREGRDQNPSTWGNVVAALYEDRDGNLWVGTWDGIARFKDGRFIEEKYLSEQLKGRVYVITGDRTGGIWFGMESGAGLYRLLDGEVTHYTSRDGLAGDTIDSIREDRAGRLWVGTDKGLSRFTGNRFQTVAAIGTTGPAVSALYEDSQGVLWIGTHGNGMYRLTGDGAQVTHYTNAQGLPSDEVDLILEDDIGFMWLTSNLGLVRMRKQDLEDFASGRISAFTSTRFGRADGLINPLNGSTAEPIGRGLKRRDGTLLFGTSQGVAEVDPTRVSFNSLPPPVVIEACLLDRHPAEFKGGLRMAPRQDNLEINYTALSMVKSDQIRFRYKLDRQDQDWVEAGTRRTAYYSHIPAGDYVFKVIAANSDGVWNTEGQSLAIRVLPPFYDTWWFRMLVTLGVAGLALLAYKYRIRQLQQVQRAQQRFSQQLIASQEIERKRIAAELHDNLGQHLVVIKNLALMLLQQRTANSDLQQIEDISSTASQAISEVREISYNLRPYQLDRIGLTKAIETLLKKAEAASGIHFVAAVDDLKEVLPRDSEINLYRIVQECVNNIIKHSKASEATVTSRHLGNRLLMTIRDNGTGFTPGAATGNAHGFGLLGIAERAQLLGGQASIHSAPGQGTTTTLEIVLQEGGGHNGR